MIYCAPKDLSNAVATICPDIKSRAARFPEPDERSLWWELSSCILSSQVPYQLATAAADAIDEQGILSVGIPDYKRLTQELITILLTPLSINGKFRMYRFPRARAHHLADARAVVASEKCTLKELVDGFEDATKARAWLVKYVPGVGPKQASMFLRNAGVSYDLAILDRHVLNYMSMIGIYSGTSRSVSGLAQYRKHEAVLREHAMELGCPVGILDWAIWIVMRVANRTMGGATL